jgi:diguanylate cyclase (GGDEF)-like protein
MVRWIAAQTLFALSCVVPATLLATLWVYGGDLSRKLDGHTILIFSMAVALVETLVFTPVVAIRSVRTMRELNVVRDELVRLACTDPLTGLLNRRGFESVAARAVDALSSRGRPAAVLMCDLDHFKEVNDAFGHEFGDAVLRSAADLLRQTVDRDHVFLARLGGEEFVAVLGDCGSGEALVLAEGIRRTFAAHAFAWNGASATITLSIGFAATSERERTVSALLAKADAALYEAKRAGRNQVAASAAPLPAAA